MTDRLRLPEVLTGPYEHALICTYSADLGFFEHDLWRKLGRARNRIVLVDDLQLAEVFADAAAGGAPLRHVNINYVAGPIGCRRAAHAKLILLVGTDVGSLLVGSGNLGFGGYASQGEMFCQYQYSGRDRDHLSAFHAVRGFLDEFARRGYLDHTVQRHLAHLWTAARWLYQPAPHRDTPVRHNLSTPLLDQLVAVVDGPVDEVVAHAPFHDRHCLALQEILTRLNRAHTTVVVQDHETSVDRHALAAVLSTHPRPTKIVAAAAPIAGSYLHAKFILVRQGDRSVVLQGSPNLSLAALCHADPEGNIELANLITGPVSLFHDILAGLAPQPRNHRPRLARPEVQERRPPRQDRDPAATRC